MAQGDAFARGTDGNQPVRSGIDLVFDHTLQRRDIKLTAAERSDESRKRAAEHGLHSLVRVAQQRKWARTISIAIVPAKTLQSLWTAPARLDESVDLPVAKRFSIMLLRVALLALSVLTLSAPALGDVPVPRLEAACPQPFGHPER